VAELKTLQGRQLSSLQSMRAELKLMIESGSGLVPPAGTGGCAEGCVEPAQQTHTHTTLCNVRELPLTLRSQRFS